MLTEHRWHKKWKTYILQVGPAKTQACLRVNKQYLLNGIWEFKIFCHHNLHKNASVFYEWNASLYIILYTVSRRVWPFIPREKEL